MQGLCPRIVDNSGDLYIIQQILIRVKREIDEHNGYRECSICGLSSCVANPASAASSQVNSQYNSPLTQLMINLLHNDEKQIHATVDSMAVVFTKASIRISLLLNDADEVEEGEGSEQPTKSQPPPSPTQPSVGDQPYVTESSSGPDNTHSPSMNLEGTGGNEGDQELLSLCTNLSNRVHALETAKDAQAAKILKLKTRIKKLEKKCKPSISHHRAWLKSVKRLSMKKSFGKKEPVFKQGRKMVTLDLPWSLDDLDLINPKVVLEKGGSNEEPVNAAGNIRVSTAINMSTASRPKVSTATPMTPPTTKSVFKDEDIFLTNALPLPKIDPKDKGKGVLEEEPEPVKVKSKDQGEAQIERDAKIALKVQAKLNEEARLERQRQEQASLNYIVNLYDEVQARINADHELAVRWTQEEQEKYTVDERAKLLLEYFENRKKYKHAQLNKKNLEEIQVLYIKEQERIAYFVPIGSEEDEILIQKMNKNVAGVHKEKALEEPDSTKVEVKMQKTNSDLEEEEHLKTFLRLVPDEEGILYYEILEKRFPIINWESKFYHLDRHGAECIYYRRFESTTLEGVDLVLWGDLRTMFDANTEDELWQNQEREKIHRHKKKTLEMMNVLLKLIAESASESAYNLLRFIQKQIDEYGSYDGSEKDL
ncbi:hypothetical protein Tco_1018330 [Tanacetum coccineum]|uniref:Uncharacterized protein n=1 Tax=Tanacetum coccineum TaxID=301880 RepID=A0ABQ5FU74_9ASTR